MRGVFVYIRVYITFCIQITFFFLKGGNMKKRRLTLLTPVIPALVLAMVIALPGATSALENEFVLGLGVGSGDTKSSGGSDGKIESLTLELGYKRFFPGLESTDTPYGLREYTQHPSRISIDFSGTDATVDDKASSSEIMTIALSEVHIGGMYYTDKEDYSTGLGVEMTVSETVREETGTGKKYESDTRAMSMVLQQYIERIRLEAGFETQRTESKQTPGGSTTKYDQRTFSFGASALIEEFISLSLMFGRGEREFDNGGDTYDVEEVEIEAGVYPAKNIGILVSHSAETTERPGGGEDELTNTSLEAKYFLNEQMRLSATYMKVKREDPSTEMTIDTILARIGYFF
jgi:hypothetical protein